MGGNPVDNKAVDILAAAAGVPTPAEARRTWAAVWRHRKLALILGGVGLAAAGGGYGYKYIKATPSTANAEPPAVAAPKPDDPKPAPPKNDSDITLPPIQPVKVDPPTPDVPVIPDISPPIDIKVPTADKTDTAPAPVLPPLISPPAVKKPTGGDNDPPDIAPPPIPEVKLPPTDKKKPATDGDATFKATGPVPTDRKPAALPADVTDKKKPDAPVLPVQNTDPPKVEVPAAPRVEVPAAPKIEGPAADKKDPPAVPMIPNTDIATPPPPGPVKTDDPPVIAPPPATDDKIPTITVPSIRPGPKPDVPPVTIHPMADLPPLPAGDPPAKPPVSADPPAISVPTIDVKAGPAPAAAGPDKRDTYNEDWHAWKDGDTMALISQEYYHDAKYAAALDAYNKEHRKPGDKYVRVPDLWKLEELFPNLIKGDRNDRADPPSRSRTPEARATSNDGPRFEPVAPLPSARSAPPAATTKASDEYKVTKEAGETIREVARKALGDGNAWRRLYELNPGIDPTLPLPAGTIVRLPR